MPRSTLTADFDAGLAADGLVVPGVGAYAACMAGLRSVRGDRLIGRRLAGGRPVLGICVGMQVLFARGVEHGVETEGCDEWPGVVERLQAPIVPHMGWNTVEVPDGTSLFAGVEGERFYFVHSYGVRDWTLVTHGRTRPPLVTWAETGPPGEGETGSSRPSRTARSPPPSSTPRSPATPEPTCSATGCPPSLLSRPSFGSSRAWFGSSRA